MFAAGSVKDSPFPHFPVSALRMRGRVFLLYCQHGAVKGNSTCCLRKINNGPLQKLSFLPVKNRLNVLDEVWVKFEEFCFEFFSPLAVYFSQKNANRWNCLSPHHVGNTRGTLFCACAVRKRGILKPNVTQGCSLPFLPALTEIPERWRGATKVDNTNTLQPQAALSVLATTYRYANPRSGSRVLCLSKVKFGSISTKMGSYQRTANCVASHWGQAAIPLICGRT